MMLASVIRTRRWRRNSRLLLLSGVAAAGILCCCLLDRIPLNPGYHDFVDRTRILGIPNALDVLSSLPFLLVGILGLVFLLSPSARISFRETRERLPYLVFFLGVALTGLGSTYYHLAPGDRRL